MTWKQKDWPDIFKKYINKEADEKKLVWTGRLAIAASMFVAVVFTWNDTLGIGGEVGFTFIQKYTGFISPGVFAVFILGMFWKRTTGSAALVGIFTGFLLSIFFNSYAVGIFGKETLLYTAFEYQKLDNGIVKTIIEIPFLINMGWSFFFTVAAMGIVSLAGPKINEKAFIFEKDMFKLEPRTIIMIVAALMILAALYVRFW
jgi:SSS family solute:Na+ symporter